MRLHNDRYEEIKSIVVATFEKYSIHTLPIDCFELADKMNIKIFPFSSLDENQLNKIQFCEGEAIMFSIDQGTFIFYNDFDNNFERQRFSIFHEIGHLVLGHCNESELAKSEADFFARYAIAPIPLVWMTNCLKVTDIQKKFNTSFECATNIKKNYDNWTKYSKRLKKYEKILLKNFHFI